MQRLSFVEAESKHVPSAMYTAITPFGEYRVIGSKQRWTFSFNADYPNGVTNYRSAPLAQAAAQVDFDKRVLACLGEPCATAVGELMAEQNLSVSGVIRQALRLYQLEHYKRQGRVVDSPPHGCPDPEA